MELPTHPPSSLPLLRDSSLPLYTSPSHANLCSPFTSPPPKTSTPYPSPFCSSFPLPPPPSSRYPLLPVSSLLLPSLPARGGSTQTGLALKYILKKGFPGGRNATVPRIVILLSDGKSQGGVLKAATELKQTGVTLFAVGLRDRKSTRLNSSH